MALKFPVKPRYSSVFVFILLTLSLFTICTSSLTIKDTKEDSNNDSFIIELVEKPVFMYFNSLKNELKTTFSYNYIPVLKTKIDNYRNSILDTHKRAIESISSLFEANGYKNIVFSHEYTGIFNGFCIKNMPVSLIDKIKELSFVKNIYPNYKFSVCLDESVPLINASNVWNLHDTSGNGLTGYGIDIAILDTGVDYNHQDLKSSYVDGYDFVNNDNDPLDDNGHGTHCAGILAGDGKGSNYKYVGVAPDANLYVFKILNSDGTGDSDDYLSALNAAVDPNGDGDPSDHVDIISISFGTEKAGTPDDFISRKADEIVNMGIVVIAAAGNNGPTNSSITSPGCSLKSITVGASYKNSEIASSSSRGPVKFNTSFYVKPDVVAPGIGITSTSISGGYIPMSGTSMAAPHIAGAAALLLQAHPDWTPEMVKNALKETAIDLGYDENTQGSGRINVLNAINLSIAPPIAILNIPKYLPKNNITINGTAMNGTGNSIDFLNYSLYYRFNQEWIKLTEKTSEINNSILCSWDTTNLESGCYELKLVVHSTDQTSIALKEINLGYTGLIIEYNETVFEKEKFNVKIFNNDLEPVSAFIIFISQYHITQIKYGSSVWFKAPNIFNPSLQNLTGKIIVLKISGLQKNIGSIRISKK